MLASIKTALCFGVPIFIELLEARVASLGVV